MSAKSSTGSAAQSVQKWVIDSDVEKQLRSRVLKRRMLDESLSHGSIVLSLKCPNLTAIGWGEQQPFSSFPSLIRVNLSGCPKLESIPRGSFVGCEHPVSVVFGEHSNITKIGEGAFAQCHALTSITLPDKLKVIEQVTFGSCASLKRVVCNKNLKLLAVAHSNSAPSLMMSSLHPNRFPSFALHSLRVIA